MNLLGVVEPGEVYPFHADSLARHDENEKKERRYQRLLVQMFTWHEPRFQRLDGISRILPQLP